MKKIMLFTAVWCPSCLIMRPRYQTIVREHPDIQLEEYDFDESPALIKQCAVGKTLPVAILFDSQKKEIDRYVGEISLKKLLDTFKSI